MKKPIILLIIILLIFTISGCKKNQNLNEINHVNLTEEEKDILDLVGIKSDIEIYSYKVDDAYNSISIWLETYENGELISDETKMRSQINMNEGEIAIVVDKASNFEWRISRIYKRV